MTTKKTADSQAVANKSLADRIDRALLKHADGKLALTPLQRYAARIIRAWLLPNLKSVELTEEARCEPYIIIRRIIYPGDRP